MRRLFLSSAVVSMACASGGFHEGRTSLAKQEQAYLVAKKGTPKGAFDRFWKSPRAAATGLVQWQADRSWACPEAPADLLQHIRDELGRLNQNAGAGENLGIAVTVYRFDPGGIWSEPTAYYELVARDARGQVMWAADDKVEATREMATSLVEPASSIIAREILRKARTAGP